jgi:hypothetical protein
MSIDVEGDALAPDGTRALWVGFLLIVAVIAAGFLAVL